MTRLTNVDALKEGIAELKRSPWYNNETIPSLHAGIKEAVEVVERLCIDKAPTVDAEPVRHGKWMEMIEVNELGEPYQSGVYCSECGHTDCYELNYCPDCGARMDK